MGLKEAYEKASTSRDYFVEEEVVDYLRSFIADNERKIEVAKKRLTLTQEAPGLEEKVASALSLCVPLCLFVGSMVYFRGSEVGLKPPLDCPPCVCLTINFLHN